MGVNYLPVNAAPVVDDLVVVTGARINTQNQPGNQPPAVTIAFPSPAQGGATTFDAGANAPLQAVKDRTAITVRWAAHDDNGDDLTYALYLRGDGETVWRLLKDNITDKAYSFDATLIPDGGYQVKVVASDAPSHTPGDALTGAKDERALRGGHHAAGDRRAQGNADAPLGLQCRPLSAAVSRNL